MGLQCVLSGEYHNILFLYSSGNAVCVPKGLKGLSVILIFLAFDSIATQHNSARIVIWYLYGCYINIFHGSVCMYECVWLVVLSVLCEAQMAVQYTG